MDKLATVFFIFMHKDVKNRFSVRQCSRPNLQDDDWLILKELRMSAPFHTRRQEALKSFRSLQDIIF